MMKNNLTTELSKYEYVHPKENQDIVNSDCLVLDENLK